MCGLKKEYILTIIFALETKDSEWNWNSENRNQLNGKIPSELGLLSSLEVLDLSKFILLHYQHCKEYILFNVFPCIFKMGIN